VHWLFTKRLTVNQATGIRFVGWVVFDDFPLKDADEDFIKGKVVSLRFFVCVIGNANTIMPYSINALVLPDSDQQQTDACTRHAKARRFYNAFAEPPFFPLWSLVN